MSRFFLNFFKFSHICKELTYGCFPQRKEAFLAGETVTHSRSWESILIIKALLNTFNGRQFWLNFWPHFLSIITEYAHGAASLNA
jgi:hypothetical protein